MPPNRRRRTPKREKGPSAEVMAGWTPQQREVYRVNQLLRTPIAELKLSVRIVNTLENHGIILVGNLVEQSVDTLMGMTNFGEKTMVEIEAALKELGLSPPVEWIPEPKKRKK